MTAVLVEILRRLIVASKLCSYPPRLNALLLSSIQSLFCSPNNTLLLLCDTHTAKYIWKCSCIFGKNTRLLLLSYPMRSTALSFIFRFLLGFFFISHSFPVLDLQMTDVSAILGIALIGVGAASAVYGVILCYTTKVRKCAATTTMPKSYGIVHTPTKIAWKQTYREESYKLWGYTKKGLWVN